MKRIIPTVLALAISACSMAPAFSAEDTITLNRDAYVEQCTNIIYDYDPFIALARAMGRGIGPGVRVDIGEICKCYADEHSNRMSAGNITQHGHMWIMDQEFSYFQHRDIRRIHSSVRPYVMQDVKTCSPHFLNTQV